MGTELENLKTIVEILPSSPLRREMNRLTNSDVSTTSRMMTTSVDYEWLLNSSYEETTDKGYYPSINNFNTRIGKQKAQ